MQNASRLHVKDIVEQCGTLRKNSHEKLDTCAMIHDSMMILWWSMPRCCKVWQAGISEKSSACRETKPEAAMMLRARKLVTMVGAPGSAIAMNAEAEAGRREKQRTHRQWKRGNIGKNRGKNGEAKRNPSDWYWQHFRNASIQPEIWGQCAYVTLSRRSDVQIENGNIFPRSPEGPPCNPWGPWGPWGPWAGPSHDFHRSSEATSELLGISLNVHERHHVMMSMILTSTHSIFIAFLISMQQSGLDFEFWDNFKVLSCSIFLKR